MSRCEGRCRIGIRSEIIPVAAEGLVQLAAKPELEVVPLQALVIVLAKISRRRSSSSSSSISSSSSSTSSSSSSR
eukprot:13833718-Heterocapsa_arctica.AAC.1